MSSSSGRRRLSATERREQLLDAAVALAAGGDLAAVSVQDVARHAGISEGLLYHYFPTKQALLVAAVRRAADRMRAALDTAAAGPPVAVLAQSLTAYLDHVQAEPTGWLALLSARTGELAEIAAELDDHARQLALRALGIAEPSTALVLMLRSWSALEREACLVWLEQPATPRAVLEDYLTTTFLAGLEAVARHDAATRAAVDGLSGG